MAQMNSRISKANSRQRRCQEHLALGFIILGVFHGTGEILHSSLECVEREDIRNRIGSLVRWPQNWIRWSRCSLGVGDGCPGLKRVAQDVQTRGSLDSRRHGACVEWVTNSKCWLEVSVSDTSLCLLGDEIEDGCSRSFAASTRCSWDCNERLKRFVNRKPLSQWRIDKIKKIGIRIRRVQVHQLGRVYDGPSTHCKKCIWVIRPCPCNSLFDTIPPQDLLVK